MKRERAIEIINQLPEEFDLEQVIERLIFVDKVERGIDQANKGFTKSHQQVKEMFFKKTKS